jgi:serine/threonine protein kinase
MENKIYEETLKKKHYQVEKQIGEGEFGTIFQCYHTITNCSYAIKITKRKFVNNETKIMNYLPPHPNILKIFDSFEDVDFSYMVLELCQTNDLLEVISKGILSEPQAACIVKKLLEAIEHCHKNGVAHRDIKPENVLFDFDGNVKLADFGCSECFFKDGRKKNMTEDVGTPFYVPPEVILRKHCYNEKVDIWSCGVTLYAMLSGIIPFVGETNDKIFESILKTDYLRFPNEKFESVSSSVKGLIRRMVCWDPSRRISAKQALSMFTFLSFFFLHSSLLVLDFIHGFR